METGVLLWKIALIVVGEGVTNEVGEDKCMDEAVVTVEVVGEGVLEIKMGDEED